MKSVNFGLICALALSGAVFAQVPSTNDTSTTDGNQNTGMGTGALGGPTPTNLTGVGNTAAGFNALGENTSGNFNTAFGTGTLNDNAGGSNNTAIGVSALYGNTTGSGNTASGWNALMNNTNGMDNSAYGVGTMVTNTSGTGNSAYGAGALSANVTGNSNTAIGVSALYENTSGNNNVASGLLALASNKTGNSNTASGFAALQYNTTGNYNTASGYDALYYNTAGAQNSAYGLYALRDNEKGNYNVAMGSYALFANTNGSNNIAMGYKAGFEVTIGSNNIDIGNDAASGDDGTIRIGTQFTQNATYIAGIADTKLTGSAVYVTYQGQLGVLASSERYKKNIAPMGADTAKLEQLRPVSFTLKNDASATRQYGLVAEQVAKVYPELVLRDAAGRVDGVRYDELAPMLLNEVQQQKRQLTAQAAEMRELRAMIVALEDSKRSN